MKKPQNKPNCLDHQTIFFLATILIIAVWALVCVDLPDTHSTASAVSASAKKADEGPVLDATTSPTTRYLPVTFSAHDEHAQSLGDCEKCHHNISGKDETPGACSSCHNAPDASVNLRDAMHKSCKGCHADAQKKNPASKAPVECLGCHEQRK